MLLIFINVWVGVGGRWGRRLVSSYFRFLIFVLFLYFVVSRSQPFLFSLFSLSLFPLSRSYWCKEIVVSFV